MSVAVGLGLLWQAAFSVAMLRHYVGHGSSFYLDNIAGAWPYIHQHLLWIGAFIAFGAGSRGLARVLAGGGALLAVVQIVSLASGGAQQSEVLTACGVACFGVLPAIALLMPGVISARHRRIDWLSAGFLVALVLVIFDDGIVQATSGGMSVRRSGLNGVLQAIWAGWVACILALALFRRGHRPSRLAALASTGHLLVVQLVWLTSDMVVQPDIPDSLRTLLSLDSVPRVLMLATILALLVLVPRPNAPSTSGRLLVE